MTKVDSYPSRVKSTWQIIERQDPVVYAGNKVEYLNKEQVEFFAQNGFLLMHQVFSETEINEIQHVAKELQIQSPSEVISEPDNPEVIRSVFAVHENNQHFKALSCDSRLVKPVCQLLGSDVYIHQSRVNYKPGFEGKEFYWHSDFETWHVEDGMPRMRAISCAIFLSENYVYNGALMLVPGSHKFFISCVGETPENNYKQSLKKQVYGVPPHEALADLVDKGGIEMATGCAGSVIFFDCNTMHGSAGNITPYTRDNVFFVYNSVENTLIEPFAGTKPRPHFIASRSFNPISLANA